jgi:hypothetical protein
MKHTAPKGAMMQFDLPSILKAAQQSVQSPRPMARQVMALNLPLNVGAMALMVVAILTGLISALVQIMAQSSAGGEAAVIVALSPVQWALVQILAMFVGAGLITAVGRGFGGHGNFAQAVVLLAWAEFIVLLVQIVQVAAMFIVPPLALILAFVGLGLTAWLLVNFIAEMHGFSSLLKVFFGLVGAGFALLVLLATVMANIFGGPI